MYILICFYRKFKSYSRDKHPCICYHMYTYLHIHFFKKKKNHAGLTYQILPFSHAHFLYYGPKPSFKLQ